MKRTVFISIVGRPNVGKSTIMNRILGEKVAIVSNKPQTTRNCIRGILTEGEDQFVFFDTPGIHRPQNSLGDYMVTAAKSGMQQGDVVSPWLATLTKDRSPRTHRSDVPLVSNMEVPRISPSCFGCWISSLTIISVVPSFIIGVTKATSDAA